MTFNDNITLDTSGVSRGGGGRGVAIGGGLGGFGVVAAIIYFLVTGQVPAGIVGDDYQTAQPGGSDNVTAFEEQCRTGLDANRDPNCRLIAGKNSLDALWDEQLPAEAGIPYVSAHLTLFDGATQTACGTGTSQMGPFYCPGDQTVYIDVSFFNQLTQMGAENSSLAQLYILAHEWGHHIQNQLGILGQINHQDLGENGSMVRSELQADCLAGVWINRASGTIDPDTGVAFLQEPTQEQLRSALAAAQAVGDDTIYENAGMRANPDNFSHGSAESRMKWLDNGMRGGTIASCDTWRPATL
ncbi:MAG: neutral zinc metallopeptidase [Actinomycetaceae bacterium]|nr:neutral zinc metallopeptidase [Arcanobacterium sp.]MDD7504417.1 neutral zinc metallopeptidase [Actinomycetaceae bacterium]MDY6143605.1 neutral zinc metallopeptidase [Arcanobacterium sp.]